MNCNRMVILGGYGNTGLPLARLLLAATNLDLILAGRSLARAQAAAAQLNADSPGDRVIGAHADAADARSLRVVFAGVPLVAVASSTAAHAATVAQAALDSGCDYFDLQYSAAKLAALQALAPAITAAGRCFITEGGFHPGLPAVMVRGVAPHFDRLESALIGSVIKMDWARLQLSDATVEEFVGEFRDFQTQQFKAGRWQPAGWRDMLMPATMDFGRVWGRQPVMPMFLEELRSLPAQYPTLQAAGFFVGGFNWFVDWLLSPLLVAGLKLAPRRGLRPLARLLRWGLNTFSRPPYGTLLQLEAAGQAAGAPLQVTLTIAHPDGYALTAIAAAACLLQYLDGGLAAPGLWLQGQVVAPRRFLRDLDRLGAEVRLTLAGQAAAGFAEPDPPQSDRKEPQHVLSR